MYELLGRALTDAGFCARLREDPQKAAEGLGYNLTEEQLVGLKASDLRLLAEGLEERLTKREA
jgi:hypothetical protein